MFVSVHYHEACQSSSFSLCVSPRISKNPQHPCYKKVIPQPRLFALSGLNSEPQTWVRQFNEQAPTYRKEGKK